VSKFVDRKFVETPAATYRQRRLVILEIAVKHCWAARPDLVAASRAQSISLAILL